MTEDANSQFAAYTRSTAFSLSLSAKMVDRILLIEARERADAIMSDLATRYDWYEPLTSWGGFRVGNSHPPTPTEQALIRRGLIDFRRLDNKLLAASLDESWIVTVPTLTEAGHLLAALLAEAGFERPDPRVHKVGLHPDDRTKLSIEPLQQTSVLRRHDRRVDLMQPGDERYFSGSPVCRCDACAGRFAEV